MKSLFKDASFEYLFKDVHFGANRKIPVAVVIWFAFALIAVLAELFHDKINNFLIFKNVFWHLIEKKNLYLAYPEEYEDHNFYGPVFSFVIAPFAILPTWMGVILWVLSNAFFLFLAITQLPLPEKKIKAILLIAAIELMTSCHNVQFNPMVAAWIILSYTFVSEEKEFWATFFIVAGFLTKIFGIVGILFYFFSKHKLRFISSFLFWCVVLFFLPMVISSPAYITQTYVDWFHALIGKNLHVINIYKDNKQDLTVMGIIRRTFNYYDLSNLTVLIPASVLLALPLLRLKLYKNTIFQLYYLCLALISVVIFSTSAESATYVIAMVGVGIWYAINMQEKNVFNTAVLVFALFTTSLASTDLVPQIIKNDIVRRYALKALPCFIVWLILIYNLGFQKEDAFERQELKARRT
ncbi:MAG TPA: glycosyltransferase family 87 protein [Segetibacter sp.]|nr:glycosyltransferase family 87 protein [Segetibacter sp.]